LVKSVLGLDHPALYSCFGGPDTLALDVCPRPGRRQYTSCPGERNRVAVFLHSRPVVHAWAVLSDTARSGNRDRTSDSGESVDTFTAVCMILVSSASLIRGSRDLPVNPILMRAWVKPWRCSRKHRKTWL